MMDNLKIKARNKNIRKHLNITPENDPEKFPYPAYLISRIPEDQCKN